MKAAPLLDVRRQLEVGITRDVYVVHTYAIGQISGGISHYEIELAPAPDASAPRIAVITHDLATYRRACAAEDKARRFDVAWHRVLSPYGFRYSVDRFEEKA